MRTLPVGNSLDTGRGGAATSLAYSPDSQMIATGHANGCVALIPADRGAVGPTYLLGLRDDDWAAIYGEHRYRLHGDPAGRFWWTAGLCRFEPGELDGYGIERL